MAKHLLREESGTSAVEYGLLMGFIALAILGAVMVFGNAVFSNLFEVAATVFPR